MVGFGLRTTPGGAKSWIDEAKVSGRTMRRTIGRIERFTASEARAKARKLLAGMSEGHDPLLVGKSQRARAATVADVLEHYLQTRRRLRETTRVEYRELLDRYLRDWLSVPVTRISGEMVRERHAKIAQRAPGAADSVMRVLRALLRFAQATLPTGPDNGPVLPTIATSSLSAARAWSNLPRRTRHLEATDVAAWWSAVERVQSPHSRAALLALLLTGLRTNELLALRRTEVDLSRQELTIRNSKTSSFVKPIGPRLSALLGAHLASHGEERVFKVRDLRAALEQTTRHGAKVISPHDLRRTYITVAEGLDISALAVKRLVNHAISDVTAGYAQLSRDRLQHAASQVEAALIELAEPAPSVEAA
jgi:integrase